MRIPNLTKMIDRRINEALAGVFDAPRRKRRYRKRKVKGVAKRRRRRKAKKTKEAEE